MIKKISNLENTLFLDIETVSKESSFDLLSEELQELWRLKCRQFDPLKSIPEKEIAADIYDNRAGIYAEFAKVVCITVGIVRVKKGEVADVRIKSFSGHNEKKLLMDFCDLMDRHFDNPDKNYISGHNIKEFDIPFLCRRLTIHQIKFPKLLRISGKKPWQVDYLVDTLILWKFGDYKNYTSLRLLAATLGIPSPKDDIDGSQVSKVYWTEGDVDRIVKYCEKDVITVIRVVMKLLQLGDMHQDVVTLVDEEE